MISFNLVCAQGHDFEGWFRSGEAFEDQARGGVLECPVCGSNEVTKGVMAPAIARGVSRGAGGAAEAGAGRDGSTDSAPAPVPAPTVDPQKFGQFLQMMRKVREHVERNFENVGDRFASEARAIHAGDAEQRDIYGQATPDDARELSEEGITVLPLPNLPKLDG